MEVLTIHPENEEQLKAIKSVLKALKIPFDKKESLYNPAFVKKINEAEKHLNDAIILNSDKDINRFFQNLESNVQDKGFTAGR